MITTGLNQHLSPICISVNAMYIQVQVFPDLTLTDFFRRSKRCCSLPWRSALPRATRWRSEFWGIPPRHRCSQWLEDNRGKFIVKEMDRPIYALHEPSVWGGWKITIFHRRYIFMSGFFFHSHSFIKFWWKFQSTLSVDFVLFKFEKTMDPNKMGPQQLYSYN